MSSLADAYYPGYPFDPQRQPTNRARRGTATTTARSTNGEKKQITRNRASYSCKTCRKRKIKCDKVHPICGACVKNEEDCLWSSGSRSNSISLIESSPEETRHGVKRRKPSYGQKDDSDESSPAMSAQAATEKAPSSIEARLDRLTSLVESLSRSNGDEAARHLIPEFGMRKESVAPQRPATGGKKYSGDVMNGYDPFHPGFARTQEKQGTNGNGTVDRALKTGFEAGGEMPEVESPMSKMNIGYLSVEPGGKSRYVSSVYWASLTEELEQLNSLLRDQTRYESDGEGVAEKIEVEPIANDSDTPASDDSHDSRHHNSFHRAGNDQHHHNAQFRDDCPACLHHATDKAMLLSAFDAHPSRFKRMDSDMTIGIPTEKQSHILFRCWLSGVHGQLPLIYPPRALSKYEAFWQWYKNDRQHGVPMPEPTFMALLYAIWYAGSVSLSLRGVREWFPGTTRAALSSALHDQITRCLTITGFPRNASIPALAAFLMLQTILAREEEPLTSSLFVGLAIRVSQQLGLHRDPSFFDIEPWEAESRRRIFWHIYLLDSHIAVSSGLPPLLADGYFDTRMISEVKDPLLGTPEADEYEAAVESGERPRDNPDDPVTRERRSMVSVHYVVARGRYIMSAGVRRLLKIHLGTQPITSDDMAEIRRILADVDNEVNEVIKRIPTKGIPELGFSPDRDEQGQNLLADHHPDLARPPTEEELRPFVGMTPRDGLNTRTIKYHWNTLLSFHKWARIMLSLIIDKVYCVSYQPFLKNAKSKFWATARQCALRHCHGYMRKFIALATDPAFQPFQWSWPGMNQPMHAAMIMLVDLYERPRSVEAPRSRVFIDKIFSMSGPDGGIVSGEDGVSVQRPLREGGREAWEMLRRLRDKAWRKAGLDPDFLWLSEESQVQAGVAQPLTEEQKVAQSLREDAADYKTDEMGGSVPRTKSSLPGASEVTSSAVDNPVDPAKDTKSASKVSDNNVNGISMPAVESGYRENRGATLQVPSSHPTTSNARTTLDSTLTQPPTGNATGFPSFDTTASIAIPAAAAASNLYFNPPSTSSSSMTYNTSNNTGSTFAGTTPVLPEQTLPANAPLYVHDGPSQTLPPVDTTDPPATATHEHSHDHDLWAQWDAVFGTQPMLGDLMEVDGVGWEAEKHGRDEEEYMS